MRFAPPSCSEGDTTSSRDSTDKISISSFHTVDEGRFSMTLPTEKMSIVGGAQGLNSKDQDVIRHDSQINASLSELMNEMRTRDSIQKQEIANIRAEMAELISEIPD
ncbi:hypothetical protein OnM2_000030 [Erysiphe neolycopersici]|uniref:Uncharacterized protein n=1 Tax=Erysiphe neolycopersici TaxID=212602 RepID=A0A420I8H3_9PEZI|nr:hypothetical protein OnM2_000030 [Erysiphe neolycopersici]